MHAAVFSRARNNHIPPLLHAAAPFIFYLIHFGKVDYINFVGENMKRDRPRRRLGDTFYTDECADFVKTLKAM